MDERSTFRCLETLEISVSTFLGKEERKKKKKRSTRKSGHRGRWDRSEKKARERNASHISRVSEREIPRLPRGHGLPRSDEGQDRLRARKPSMDPITAGCDPALSPLESRGAPSTEHHTGERRSESPREIHRLFSRRRQTRGEPTRGEVRISSRRNRGGEFSVRSCSRGRGNLYFPRVKRDTRVSSHKLQRDLHKRLAIRTSRNARNDRDRGNHASSGGARVSPDGNYIIIRCEINLSVSRVSSR